MLVLAPEDGVATWCAEPIVIGPDSVVTPLAIGPGLMPIVTDPAESVRNPELAVLSALAHGHGAFGMEVLTALLAAVCSINDDRTRVYSDYVLAALPEAARKHWEDLMATGTYQYRSDFARRYYAEGEAKGEAGSSVGYVGDRLPADVIREEADTRPGQVVTATTTGRSCRPCIRGSGR